MRDWLWLETPSISLAFQIRGAFIINHQELLQIYRLLVIFKGYVAKGREREMHLIHAMLYISMGKGN